MAETIQIITLRLCSSTEGSGMTSANSSGGFILTRAIDRNLDPPFFYNPLSKKNKFVILNGIAHIHTHAYDHRNSGMSGTMFRC